MATSGNSFRVGLIAVKNTLEEQLWLLSFLKDVETEPYCPGKRYDLVWFLNVTPELKRIKAHTDMKTMVVGMEPEFMYPLNYDADLLSLADRYTGYRNFASEEFQGTFEPYTFPIYPEERIRKEFAESLTSERDHDFCCFATHDPNIRKALGNAASRYQAILAGPLFGERVPRKVDVERRCRYELITENDINDYYFSEKIGEALTAGCVPVYWGCSAIKDRVPPDLFIDMSDFAGNDGVPDVQTVIEYCMQPGVYDKHVEAIRTKALDFLMGLSLEECLIDPFQRYVNELKGLGWRAREFSYSWTLRRLRSLLPRREVV